ncbi:MAG: EamA family transporter [Clostridiales bacterium]|nr:EamA family transporter [Clostridiales bacterium]
MEYLGPFGFTALYIIITPVLERLTGRRITKYVWIGAVIAMVGMYLLCLSGGLSGFTFGDAMMLCAAFACSIQVIVVDQCVHSCIIPILYAALASCGIGYTFQVIGQKYTPPSQATLLLSLETVFSLFAGMLFFKEVMTITEYIGCAVMFVAIIISQGRRRLS